MTLVEFIKSKLSKDNSFGDLANDILNDKEFPIEKSENEIISYLDFQTSRGGTNDVFKRFLAKYKKHLKNLENKTESILEANYSVLRSETWKYYKEFFIVNKVCLVGKINDIYKVYCIDTKRGKALLLDLKSNSELNDINLMDEENIFIGDLTQQTSVGEAIDILVNCNYNFENKPNDYKFTELLEFLRINK